MRPSLVLCVAACLGLLACNSDPDTGQGVAPGDASTAADTAGADDAPQSDTPGSDDDTSISPEDTGLVPCAPDQCDIDGECYDNGTANPDASCLVCRVLIANDDWSADDAADCDDDTPCTTDDQCNDGVCAGEPLCDDDDPCTDDLCDETTGECSTELNNAPCVLDDTPCLAAECSDGACMSLGTTRQCDDGDPCTVDTCDEALGCVSAPAAEGPCDDGNPCTTDDVCLDGTCAGTAVDCNDNNVCTVDVCDGETGCIYKPLDDQCADGNLCTDDSCDAVLGCVFTPNTVACDDGSVCTANDTCGEGLCAGAPVPADDNNPCTTDSCDPVLGPVFTPNTAPCDDGDACTLGDICAAGGCTPGPGAPVCEDDNFCTDDECAPESGCVNPPNTAPCDDGTVCTTGDFCQNGACAGAPITCNDDNICTTDTCDPVEGCVFTVITSNACRPTIDVVYPPRGATIAGNIGDPVVTVSGSVFSEAGPITSLTINDIAVPVSADGSFSWNMPAQIGGNTLVLTAVDALGTSRSRVQAYLWSDTYLNPTVPVTDPVSPGLGIWFSQTALDDNDPSLPPNDLATIFKLVLDQFDIASLIGGSDGPLASQSGFDIYLDSLVYGGTDVDLVAVDGGLAIAASINDLEGFMTFDCTNIGCFFLGGDSSGGLTVDSVSITATIVLSANEDGTLNVQLNNVNTQFSGVDIYSNNGWTNFLLSIIEGAIIGGVIGDLQNELSGQLDTLLAPLLGDALGALAFNLSLDLPKLDGSGVIPIALNTDFESVDFQDQDPGPQGGVLAQNAGAYTPVVATPYQNLGIPARSGCGAGPQVLAVPRQGTLELVLADDVLNHILYAAWRGGLLEFDVPASLLGDFDLSEFGISDLDLTLSGLLAPTAADCGNDGELLVHIGDARIDASLNLLGAPINVVIWATFTAGLELTAAPDGLGISITSIEDLDTEVTVQQDAFIGTEAVIQELIEDELVGGLLELLGGGALGSIPLPEIDLSEAIGLAPGSAVIAISPQSVSRLDGNTVVDAILAQ